MKTEPRAMKAFRRTVWDYYHTYGRALPWRPPILPLSPEDTLDPYAILVSEIMLQQTSVTRVSAKYREFMRVFPNVKTLAEATLQEVLIVWSGLGYNRRAKFLHQAARQVMGQYNGRLPDTFKDLVSLPGVGPNTAGAILAYAFNQPAVYVETNIRTVFLHHFFEGHPEVTDHQIKELLEQSLTFESNYREFYWALMDYGSYLKKEAGSLLHQSKSYTRQSVFEGSRRQLRGAIVKLLAAQPQSYTELTGVLKDERLNETLQNLQQEGMIVQSGNFYTLPPS